MSASSFRILDEAGRVVEGQDVPDIDDAKLVHLYESMRRIRLTDERMMNLQRTGRIGFYGTATGQEASVLGTVAALGPNDWVLPALREAGAAVYRGLPLDKFVAQLVGNAGDVTLGRQMPCHFSYREGGYVSMSSVIGTQISHAAGVGIAAKIRGDDTVVMGYMGDGATSSNDFHAGLNFAAVKKAPVVFVCQNNHWAISVPVSDQMASDGIAIKAPGYGIPGVRVDGNDLLAVYKVSCDAVARARAGVGPTFLECVTYRRGGHSSSDDPTRYRDDAEVAKWEARDPIDRMKAFLVGRELWSEEQEAEHDAAYLERLNTAITAALEADAPHPDTMFDDVYEELPPNLAAQRDNLRSLQEAEESVGGAFPL